jgi:very-short-patch-repair endonuclease
MPESQRRPTRRAQSLRNNATDAERCLWRCLSRRQLGGFKFSRQIPVGPFVCDFLCRERGLIVEVDGGQHADNSQDDSRTAYLASAGYRVIRFWNNEVLQNTDGVLQAIKTSLEQLPQRFTRPPLPLAGGEEPRSGDGVGLFDDILAHPQPPPASGRGL